VRINVRHRGKIFYGPGRVSLGRRVLRCELVRMTLISGPGLLAVKKTCEWLSGGHGWAGRSGKGGLVENSKGGL